MALKYHRARTPEKLQLSRYKWHERKAGVYFHSWVHGRKTYEEAVELTKFWIEEGYKPPLSRDRFGCQADPILFTKFFAEG